MTCLAVLKLSVNHTQILLDSTVEKHNSSIHRTGRICCHAVTGAENLDQPNGAMGKK